MRSDVQVEIEIVESAADMNAAVPEATVDTSQFVDPTDAAKIANKCASTADIAACGANEAAALAPPPLPPPAPVDPPGNSQDSPLGSAAPPPPMSAISPSTLSVPTAVVLERLNTTVRVLAASFCCFIGRIAACLCSCHRRHSAMHLL